MARISIAQEYHLPARTKPGEFPVYFRPMTADFFQFRRQIVNPRGAAAAGVAKSAASAAGGAEAALTVTQLTERIKRVLGSGIPETLLVRGEVSNLNRNRVSGHLYFTLKDAEACLDCVMFRSESARLKFEPAAGIELLASGRIGVYPQRGRYQLYVNDLRPLGQGALELAFRQVKAKLEAEGLFAPERKKPLPAFPARIVLVTSQGAAALQDILKVLHRFPWLRVMLYPVPVQGEGAAEKIAAAIDHVNASVGRVGGGDVILLARGGGSLEDLWSFNEESVARAVAASRIPVVTGIGHEVDVSIADLAADYHAHTPTEAAQVITARWRGAGELLDGSAHRLLRGLRVVVGEGRARLEMAERHEAFRRPADRVNQLRQLLDDRQRAMVVGQQQILRDAADRIGTARSRLERFLPGTMLRLGQLLADFRHRLGQGFAQRLRGVQDRVARLQATLQACHPKFKVRLVEQQLDTAEARLARDVRQDLQRRTVKLDSLARQLEAVSPRSVLARGYTMTSRKKDGVPLRAAAQLKPGDKIVTHFADGQVESTVDDSKQLSLFE